MSERASRVRESVRPRVLLARTVRVCGTTVASRSPATSFDEGTRRDLAPLGSTGARP